MSFRVVASPVVSGQGEHTSIEVDAKLVHSGYALPYQLQELIFHLPKGDRRRMIVAPGSILVGSQRVEGNSSFTFGLVV